MWAQGNHAIPLPMPDDAGGAKAGRPEDASAGFRRITDAQGLPWAWNPVANEWQRIHTIRSGDTLWNLSGTYYGTKSLPGVRAIFNVPQNKAIQGASPDTGLIPGDRILIPGLRQPAAAPIEVSEPGPVEVPTPEPDEPTIGVTPPDVVTVPPIPSIPGDLIPAPPEGIPVGAPAPEPSPAPPKKKDRTLLLVGVVGAGALLVGGAALVMKKRRRRNPRRRRR